MIRISSIGYLFDDEKQIREEEYKATTPSHNSMGTINNATLVALIILYVLFTSSCFEEAIKKIIFFGGDTDTNACIVGSMAEALYGIDESLIEQAKLKIPPKFNEKLEEGYKRVRKRPC